MGNLIYIIDDDPICHLITSIMLQDLQPDLIIESFYNGFQAMEALKRLELKDWPKVLVTDLDMPEMDGWELLASLNSLGKQPSLHVVVLSASNLAKTTERAYEMGVNEVLLKPLSLEAGRLLCARLAQPGF